MSIHRTFTIKTLLCLAALVLAVSTAGVLIGAENPFKAPEGAVQGDANHKVQDDWEEFEETNVQAVLTVTTNDDPGVYNDLHYEIEYHGKCLDNEPPPPHYVLVTIQSKWDIKCPPGKFLNAATTLKIPPPADIDQVLHAFFMVVWTKDDVAKLYRIGEVD